MSQSIVVSNMVRSSCYSGLLLVMLSCFDSQANQQKFPPVRKSAAPQYVGDSACASCHKDQAETFGRTAHHLTSRLPNSKSILGNFSVGGNVLRTSNPYLTFVMSSNKQEFFQSAVEEIGPGKKISHTELIDLVIGSGRKGQTYLFWKGDRLFELPVSYWTELNSWINSPGYPDGSPHFDKAVVPRCLECHTSFFKPLVPGVNRFNRSSLTLGITCEKCHGPGRDHANFYKSGRQAADKPAFITNPSKLSRDRQIDLCALCHAGTGTAIAPALSFTPGKAIDDYFYIPDSGTDAAVDVHGNQIELLRRSRCFQSTAMTCTTCHDVHKPQRDAAAFSAHCLSCHKEQECGEFPKLGAKISDNCIDCHMPLQKSQTLVSDTNGKNLRPLVRNHRIAIYAAQQQP